MTDIVLESVRAFVLFGLVLFLLYIGRTRFSTISRGWNWVIAGFCLLLFGSLLDISDNFETLNRFVVIGDTEAEAFLEKFVGFLGGFVVVAVGLVRWIPKEMAGRRRAEELLTAAIEGMPEGFAYYDIDDRLAVFNKKMAQTYPLIADVFQPGTTFEEVLRTGIEKGQFVEAQNREEEFFKETLAYHRDPKGAVVYNLPDGRCILVEETKIPAGGIVGLRTDITSLKKIERELRDAGDNLKTRVAERTKELLESEERFRFAFENAPIGMALITPEGNRFKVNKALADFLGYTVEELTDTDMKSTAADLEALDKSMRLRQKVLDGEIDTYQNERRYRHKKGHVVWGEVSGSLFRNEDGEPKHFIAHTIDITERKRAEEALRKARDDLEARVEERTKKLMQSEALFRAVVNHSPTKIHIKDAEGRYTLINREAEKLFGVTDEEGRGKTSHEIFSRELADSFAAHDQAVLESGQIVEVEEEWQREGGLRTYLTVKFPIRDAAGEIVAVGAIGTDITERKRAEERFRTLIDSSSQGILVHRHFRPLYANLTLVKMFGYDTVEDILALDSSAALFAPEEIPRVREYHEARLQGKFAPKDHESKGLRKDGSKIWLNSRAFRIEWEDGPAICTTLYDITERKEAQAQLIQASKLATLGEMASGIAHELNQPLCVVGLSAELSLMSMDKGGFDTEFVRHKLQMIVGQKERMASIVNHMRLFSRKDTTGMEWFNPVDCVAGAVGLVDGQFRTSGIKLTLTLPATCRNVCGHPLQLEQVVLNLLNNARDEVLGAMKSAGSGQSHPAPMVRVSLVDDKRRKSLVISVADTGGGISEQALERIFDPFFTTKKEGQGTGLGLSIGYSIIDAMGGSLEAQNAEDGGAEFRISLPAAVDGSGAVERRSRKKKRQGGTRKRRSDLPRVLVVDDEEVIAEELAKYLQLKGYDVAVAGSGLEALEAHRSRPADVVITDLFMPEMDGNELIRRLHRTDPDLPIMVITGHTTFGDEKESVTEGASLVLKKPIDLSELFSTLSNLVRS